MSARQKATTETYDAVATEFLENTRDFPRGVEQVERFKGVVPVGTLVADLGSGPGRDTHHLRAQGINSFCLDLSLGMLRAGQIEYPASRIQGSLLALPLRSSSLAGAWANASLLHLSTREFGVALREIRRVLVPSGHLHLTLKRGNGSEWESSRYGRPRWFQYWSGPDLDRALEEADLTPVFRAEQEAASATWLVRLCRAT